ncbi:hypothetical protein BKA70DRAFT_1222108 [Coprinopsis sp. MPI-PUGE-AT-0042]|nr:hypothetical protein BKA70DRAFT_1222108 [Coprinopsis sp. MPI-PUGE-AT-0042]
MSTNATPTPIAIPKPHADSDPCTTANNVCQRLFNEGIKTDATQVSKTPVQYQGLVSVWNRESNELTNLGKGTGSTAQAAKNAAAAAAILYLYGAYPGQIVYQ